MPGSEQEFLELIDKFFPREHEHVLIGRGDDCAVIRCPETMCVTTDLFLEDVHFRRSYFEPFDIGWKALAVNVSDIYGMGAKPLGFSLALSGPKDTEEEFWTAFLRGMSAFAKEHDVALTGGDLSGSDRVNLSVTVWGAPWTGKEYALRGQTQVGDVLFVAGTPGLARAGLLTLEAEGRGARGLYPACVAAHLRPKLHAEAAKLLAGREGLRGLMDVSDGLAQDLPRFVAPGQGVEVTLREEDLHFEVLAYGRERGVEPLPFALAGGEDYMLLGAATPGEWEKISKDVPDVLKIGMVADVPGIRKDGMEIKAKGFDHFSK